MPRFAMGIEYHGTHYYGWQKQNDVVTVQSTLEEALSKVANTPIKIYCAGRTDAGVHATGQVAHFDTEVIRTERAWLLGTNVNLPHSIRIKWIKPVADDFHARFSALNRRYHYWIYNRPMSTAILSERVTWHIQPLDVDRMQEAANYLIGEHDFSSFRGRHCQAESPVRTILEAKIIRHQHFVLLDICGNGFLHHMVRNIMGVLLAIGNNKAEPIWMAQLLEQRQRKLAGVTAPPDGLYLFDITYPAEYAIPQNESLF